MKVKVKFYGVLKEGGYGEREVKISKENAKVKDILEIFGSDLRKEEAILIIKNSEISSREDILNDGDEVLLMAPVAGG